MRYGHVTNGAIDKGPCSLPKSWENISGLNNMSNEELRQIGWLPWEFIQATVGPNQVLNGSIVTVEPLRIVETQQVRNMTPQEIADRDQQYKDGNKQQAEQLLQETDWTQMPDVDLVNKADFTAYRAAVRAIALNPPVTVTEWPVKPNEIWA